MKNEIEVLNSLFEYAYLLSKVKIKKNEKWNIKAAFIIFKQAVDNIGTALAFLPDSPIQSQFKRLSISLIASLCRISIDNFIAISYLIQDRSDNIRSLQELSWIQAIDSEKLEMVKYIDTPNPVISQLKTNVVERETQIRNHPHFSKLEKKVRNNCARGFSDKIYRPDQIVEKLGIDRSIFWPMYTHYSQFIHSTSFAINQNAAFLSGQKGALDILKIYIADLSGIFSLTINVFADGFNINLKKEAPIGILRTLLFWDGYFHWRYKKDE